MAALCILQQQLAASAAAFSCTRKVASTSTRAAAVLGVHAQKKQQPRRQDGRNGKGSVVEKSLPQRAGKGAQVTKKNGSGDPTSSTTVSVDLGNMVGMPLPEPPAGFILDAKGGVVLVAPAANRIVSIIDPATQRPLECMIRRSFQSSDGRDCLLLLPLDMPIQILKIDEESEGLMELSDEELGKVLPTAVYSLAKRRLHLIDSGFCLTARGGFCYTEEHVLDFKTEYGEGLGGSLAEGVEISNFQVKDADYIIYTPFDPVMFVAHRDERTRQLRIADDDLLDDEVVLHAIDQENEFQALVDEEDAVREALREAK